MEAPSPCFQQHSLVANNSVTAGKGGSGGHHGTGGSATGGGMPGANGLTASEAQRGSRSFPTTTSPKSRCGIRQEAASSSSRRGC